MNTIHIRGLQRSGTNFLQQILELNYPAIEIIYSNDRSSPNHRHYRIFNKNELQQNYKEHINDSIFVHEKLISDLKTYESYTNIQNYDLILFIMKDIHHWCNSYKATGWITECSNKQLIQEYYLYLQKVKMLTDSSKKIKAIKYRDLLLDTKKVLSSLNLEIHNNIKIPNRINMSPQFDKIKTLNYIKDNFIWDNFNQHELSLINNLQLINKYQQLTNL